MDKKLVIVESPSKAKTIKKYLGKGYEVIASQGHIIDLPASRMGVDPDNNFKAEYIKMKGKAPVIKAIKEEAKKADKIYLATDPDREGEAISWHLKNELNIPEGEKCRIAFNEITEKAVNDAVKNARTVDMDIVNAQQARRILDRLVGYKISPLLWKKVKRGLSAGRVQSVALRIIIDRENEIKAFIPEEYWNLDVLLSKAGEKRDVFAKFYGDKNGKIDLKNEKQVMDIVDVIKGKTYTVVEVKKSEKKRNPAPPFTTSSLQQDGSKKFGYPVKKTMMIAQRLYEAGYITYMRTDSIRISDEAHKMAMGYILNTFGKDYYNARNFKSKASSQDAHEAIRPTNLANVEMLKNILPKDELKLYMLIYNRFLASQMSSAIYDSTKIVLNVEDYIFNANGSVIKFDGFMKLYIETKDDDEKKQDNDNEEEVDENDRVLPEVKEGDKLTEKELNFAQKFTEPPARYTEASLVKVLEEKGIGRPSTYAPTISTIIDRLYVERDRKYLVPTELGTVVNSILVQHFENIVDVAFTADMEDKLDKVSEGKQDYIVMLKEFYTPFIQNLEKVEGEIERVKLTEEISDVVCELCGKNMVVKQGRFGKFLACPGYPECKNTKPIVEEISEPCPQCGGKILVRKTKTKRNFYVCENNTNNESKTCDYISWNKPGVESKPNNYRKTASSKTKGKSASKSETSIKKKTSTKKKSVKNS